MVGGGHASPDKTKLAMWQKNEIVIWDLDQGEVARVQGLERVRFNGEISWSPDGQSLVYLQTEWDCAPDYGKTYLTRLNLSDMSQELLFEHDAPGFGRVSWDTMNQLTLRDGNNNEWTYNLVSKELKSIPQVHSLMQVLCVAAEDEPYHHIIHDPLNRCVVVGEDSCGFIACS